MWGGEQWRDTGVSPALGEEECKATENTPALTVHGRLQPCIGQQTPVLRGQRGLEVRKDVMSEHGLSGCTEEMALSCVAGRGARRYSTRERRLLLKTGLIWLGWH